MNTQILHCRFVTSTDNVTVYSTEEKLTSADLETIVLQNTFPISIIFQEGTLSLFNVYSPSEINLTSISVGVRANFMYVLPAKPPVREALIAMVGSVIMESYSGVTDLDPDLVYLILDHTTE